jgi:hypothetical protein
MAVLHMQETMIAKIKQTKIAKHCIMASWSEVSNIRAVTSTAHADLAGVLLTHTHANPSALEVIQCILFIQSGAVYRPLDCERYVI